MKEEEYKKRFISHLEAMGITPEIARAEHDAWVESFTDCYEDGMPEFDADEAISRWTD